MKCNLAEILIMKHFEKTIEPADAKKLAEHVMVCQTCRELYLVLDEGIEFSGTADIALESSNIPPVNFTESVMKKVREIPAYAKTTPVVRADISGGQMVLRVLWGFSAILLGIGLLFTFNPYMLASLLEAYPMMETLFGALSSLGTHSTAFFEWVAQGTAYIAVDNLGIAALFFVGVMGTLLFVLYNGENRHDSFGHRKQLR
ncbi:MAG: hypothetical protein FWE05_00750 [Defluviitaleaceae bacterium]|nr:hypothetical protein [Defluviitaleaceae bacterium]